MKNKIVKFRGFTIDLNYNVWNYGFLVGDYIVEMVLEKSGLHLMNKVDTKSIGQFTGLYDIKNSEIFEGDIVELGFMDTKYYSNIYKVVYSEKFAGFFLTGLYSDEESRSSLLDISEYIIKKYKIEVTGNTYKNENNKI